MLFRSVFAYDLIRKIFSDTLQESKIARETYLNSLTYEKLQALFTNAQTFEDIIFLLLGINNERSRKEVEKLKLLFKTHSWLLYFVELKHILFKISSVLKSADEILTISPFYLKKFQQKTTKPVRLITNGYDDRDFGSFKHFQTNKFILRHVGIVHPACDMTPFLKAFKNWVEERKFAEQVEIIFTGIVNTELQNLIQQDSLLNKIVRIEKPVSHDQLIERYAESSALLLILTGYQDAEGFLPGKMFEYIATGLPVIGTAPENSDAQSVLIQTGAGFLYRADDLAGIKIALDKLFSEWKSGIQKAIITDSARAYERKHITQELAKILLAH